MLLSIYDGLFLYVVVGRKSPGDSCRSVLAVSSVMSQGEFTERKKMNQQAKNQYLNGRIFSSQRAQRVQIQDVVACKTPPYGKSEKGQSAESRKGRKKYCLFCPPGRSCPPRFNQSERVTTRPALPLAAMILIGGCSVAFLSLFSLWGATASLLFSLALLLARQLTTISTTTTFNHIIVLSTKLYIY